MEQLAIDIKVDSFTKREKVIIKRLREYRTIDVDIEVQRRLVNGIGLLNEPRITAAAPERDYLPMLKHLSVQHTDSEREIAATVEKYVSSEEFRYATTYRVARKLRETFSEDPVEDARLQDAYDIIMRRSDSLDAVRLTDTEQIAEKRLAERAKALEKLEELQRRKEIIQFALVQMDKWYPEEYLILWHKYVMDEPWTKVCEVAGRNGIPLSPDEYRLSRKKALKHFDKWAVGLS